MEAYCDRCTPEYDDRHLGIGICEGRDRPGGQEELAELARAVRA